MSSTDYVIKNKLREIPSLTGLRFFAALFVCIPHLLTRLVSDTDAVPIWYLPLSRLSAEGMTLFFVLSGFVIHYNYSIPIKENPKIGLYNFLVARFARLWPLYFMCLSIDLFKNSHYFSALPTNFILAIPYYFTLTQSWFYHPIGDHALIYQFGQMPSVAWSVSTEWFFYLCYPIICFSLINIRRIRTKVLTMFLISIITILSIAVVSYKIVPINDFSIKIFGPIANVSTHHQDSFFRWLIYFSPYFRISEFLIGCLIAAIYIQLFDRPVTKYEAFIGFIATLGAIIGIMLSHYFIYNHPSGDKFSWLLNLHKCFGFAPSIAVLIFCCARYRNFITRFLANPGIVFGGEISYSIYLLHPAIIGTFFHHIAKITNNTSCRFLFLISLILIFSAISYRVIETPTRRWLRKRLMVNAPKETPIQQPAISQSSV